METNFHLTMYFCGVISLLNAAGERLSKEEYLQSQKKKEKEKPKVLSLCTIISQDCIIAWDSNHSIHTSFIYDI